MGKMPTMATADAACARCRERKIRCGREKNGCANCERDGVECDYFTPGKRVNHIKLLYVENHLSSENAMGRVN